MNASKAGDDWVVAEWQELGFFYDRDDDAKHWRLVGSRSGLLRFARLLREYAANPRHDAISEHAHYGPYMYLELMTWQSAGLDDHSIHGTLADLERLAVLVEQTLQDAKCGSQVALRGAYAPDAEYELYLEVRDDSFQPESADPALPGAD